MFRIFSIAVFVALLSFGRLGVCISQKSDDVVEAVQKPTIDDSSQSCMGSSDAGCVPPEEALNSQALYEEDSSDDSSDDPQSQCTLYLAESSIPNSGWGMYTGVLREEGDEVAPPEIAHQLIDRVARNLLVEYYWGSFVTGAIFEAERVDSLIPGCGMAANSFSSLINVQSFVGSSDSAGLHRSRDPGAGAFSTYHNITYVTTGKIDAGQEIFADYGEGYFVNRVQKYGMLPMKADFFWSDTKLQQFWKTMQEKIGHDDPRKVLSDEVWNAIMTVFVEDERKRNALPKTVEGIADAVHRYSAWAYLPNNPREIDWLEENGYCMDLLDIRTSTIPQAGRGAFASRFVPKGSVVAPAPLVQIERDDISNRQRGSENIPNHPQLLLNYCFGHKDSSLLLLPYSSAVSFINHDTSSPNAEIRWSTASLSHEGDWGDVSVKNIIAKDKAWLMLEVRATRDISPGEEVTFDYGSHWQEAWNTHVLDWKAPHGSNHYVSAAELNAKEDVLRTVFDQIKMPYPSNVATACHYHIPNTVNDSANIPPISTDSKDDDILSTAFESSTVLQHLNDTLPLIREHAYQWIDNSRLLFSGNHFRPCKVIEKDGDSSYLVRMYNQKVGHSIGNVLPDDKEHYVSNVPRRSIQFIDRPYTSDLHIHDSFRHEIGIPDSLFPDAWKDLK